MVINDNMAAGSLLVFNALCLKVFNPFQQITNMQSAYEQSKISKLKYEDIINTKLKKTFGKEEFLTVNELELSNVSFEYEVNRKILNNAYLKIRKNTNFALMGKSGAGKTTIGKLISNYYRLDDGNIKINGKDISTYTEKIIKEKILYVSQDVDLFNYSIMENILLGRDIKEEKVFAISEELGFDEFVKKLPNGYETVIGEKGVRLSLGQKQLLNIIRATLNDYEVIIFDEITNGLDFDLKEKVQKYLFKYGNIKVFITHDSKFAGLCDELYWIEDKKIVKRGT